MASPQKENGYTVIANEILEVLAKAKLNGTQRSILDIIFRYTYGFNRKSHEFSISFISKAIDVHVNQVQRELKKLIEMKIVSVEKNYSATTSKILKFNKNYEAWVTTKTLVPTNKLVPTKTLEESQLKSCLGTNELVGQERNTKEKLKKTYGENFEQLWSLYPKKEGKGKVSDKQKKELAKMPYEEMVRAIERYKAKLKKENVEDRYIQHGSTFFNSGYIDYLDVNYQDIKPKQNITPFVPKFIEREFGQ